MGELLREMDHGPAALPPGSEVTLFNASATTEIIERVIGRNRIRYLTVRHVLGNPLDFDEVSQRLDVPRFAFPPSSPLSFLLAFCRSLSFSC